MRVGRNLGNEIKMNVGVAQGDCLSALLLIFYLARFVNIFPGRPNREDHGGFLWSELDWLVDRDEYKVEIDPKYADVQNKSIKNQPSQKGTTRNAK